MAQAEPDFTADTLESIIILLVQDNKCLFDKTDNNYKNSTKKMDIWKDIAKKIFALSGMSVEAEKVISKWNYLKQKFVEECKKESTYIPSGSGAVNYESDWPYFESMKFLKKYISHRKTDSSFKRSVDIADASDCEHDSSSEVNTSDVEEDVEDEDVEETEQNNTTIEPMNDSTSEEESRLLDPRTVDYLSIIKGMWQKVDESKKRKCFERLIAIIENEKKQ